MKAKKETLKEKKARLLNELIEFLEEKSKENNDDHFIVDPNCPKKCMIVTNSSGEQLKLKTKIVNNELVITGITIPRR